MMLSWPICGVNADVCISAQHERAISYPIFTPNFPVKAGSIMLFSDEESALTDPGKADLITQSTQLSLLIRADQVLVICNKQEISDTDYAYGRARNC
jgi:hypothetical protein